MGLTVLNNTRDPNNEPPEKSLMATPALLNKLRTGKRGSKDYQLPRKN